MIATVYNGQNIYLADVAPRWQQPFGARVELLSTTEFSLTNRESRRPYSASLRFASVRYELLAVGADARRISSALRAMTNEAIAVPLWPAMESWANRATAAISGGLKLAYRPPSSSVGVPAQWEIYEGVEPGWVLATDFTVPLLWGRLSTRQAQWLSTEQLLWNVDFVESSPANYAVAPAAAVFTAGPLPPSWGAVTPPRLFPMGVDFAEAETGKFAVVILKEEVGFGRETADTFYPQTTAREDEARYLMSSQADAGTLLQFFLQHGSGKAFWVPEWVSAAVLNANVGPADTVLHVVDVGAVSTGDYVAFVNPDGIVAASRVTAVNSGAGTITIAAATGIAMASGSTVLTGLLLARFTSPALELQWMSNDLAVARIAARELPAEYVPAADEVLGTTLGVLPGRGYLYQFSRVLNGVTFTDRFTSYENDLDYGGHTYSSRKVTHGDLTGTLYLDRDEVQVKTDVFAGNPFLLSAQLNSESPLSVGIIEGEINGGNLVNASVVFTGEVMSVKMAGSRITATATSGGSMFDRKLPRAVFGAMCNASLFDDFCSSNGGPTKALWKFTAKIHDPGSAGYPFDFVLDTIAGSGASAIAALAGGAVLANFFALGWAEFRVAGGDELNWCRRAILQNTVIAGGQMTVSLKRDPLPFPAVNDVVWLYPGCDLQYGTCKGKFANGLNFFGHPFMPIANPTMAQAGKPSGGGKK